LIISVAAIALIATVAACAQTLPTTLPSSLSSSMSSSSAASATSHVPAGGGMMSGGVFPIGVGDLINVSVFETPELSGQLRVDPDGNVSMPLLGKVHVAGIKTDEAQKLIQERLTSADLVKEPQVSVFISEYATQGVSVWGEVRAPGVYPVLGNRRISDLISMAQGVTPAAGYFVTITRRNDPANPLRVDLRADSSAPNKGANLELQPGDTLRVERAGIVYVLGDVSKPGGFVMDHDNVTVLQALAFALGPTRTASLGHARLLRKTANGFQESPLPLKKILTAKADDPVLRADDIVYVPSSATKTTMQYGLQGILSSAAGAAIYTLR
jgi:polysaccharide export outer membrane protein